MINILDKTVRDLKKLLTPFLISLFLTTATISSLIEIFDQKTLSIESIKLWILAFVLIVILGFVIIFFTNLIIMKIIDTRICINSIDSIRTPKQKLLIQIKNNNNDDMTNVQIEFDKLMLDEIGNIESIIRVDNNFFTKGLNEKEKTISAHGSAKIEIASNNDGILVINTNDEYEWVALRGMTEAIKVQSYRFVCSINAKIGEFFFSKKIEFPFTHYIDETTRTITKVNGVDCSKRSSGLEWISRK